MIDPQKLDNMEIHILFRWLATTFRVEDDGL